MASAGAERRGQRIVVEIPPTPVATGFGWRRLKPGSCLTPTWASDRDPRGLGCLFDSDKDTVDLRISGLTGTGRVNYSRSLGAANTLTRRLTILMVVVPKRLGQELIVSLKTYHRVGELVFQPEGSPV
jgi:hypothetical protein